VCKSAQRRTSKGHHTHFRNGAQRIHYPLDPPKGPFPHIRSANWDNPLHRFIGPMESKTRILGTNKRHLFSTLWHSTASFDGLVMRQGQMMFGSGELNEPRCSSFFGMRIARYIWEAFVLVRRYNLDCYVQCDRLRRPRSFSNDILEDTRNICTQDVQLIEREGILNKTDHFERLGVSASHGCL
jgi:hypothetical protein